MTVENVGTSLPVDVSSRIQALLEMVAEIEQRVSGYPEITGLIRDFREMAREYVLLFESKLREVEGMSAGEKWLRRHEMLDKLTQEWHQIYSLAAAVDLGNSHLSEFRPYVEQAVRDVGLTDAGGDFLLIPIFGESFSLVTVGYSSSNVAILKVPISVIHSPWEFSVIWHEMAGLKVIRIRQQIKDFLAAYARERNLNLPEQQALPGSGLISELFDRIAREKTLDKAFKLKVKAVLTGGNGSAAQPVEIWSQDWFEQLYEDACSVFAFGEEFVSVLQKILGRQARKLTADAKHPDLVTRLQVARRLLELKKGNPGVPVTDAEKLTDNLLWAFINQRRGDPASALPVADADLGQGPELRRKLIEHMRDFNQKFGSLDDGTIHEERFSFGPMAEFAEKASQRPEAYLANPERTARVRESLLARFKESDVKDLLSLSFSPSDELTDFYGHAASDLFPVLYVYGNHGGHHVVHVSHV